MKLTPVALAVRLLIRQTQMEAYARRKAASLLEVSNPVEQTSQAS